MTATIDRASKLCSSASARWGRQGEFQRSGVPMRAGAAKPSLECATKNEQPIPCLPPRWCLSRSGAVCYLCPWPIADEALRVVIMGGKSAPRPRSAILPGWTVCWEGGRRRRFQVRKRLPSKKPTQGIFACFGTRHPLSALPARLASDRHAHRDQSKKKPMPGWRPAASPGGRDGHGRARRRDGYMDLGVSWVPDMLSLCPAVELQMRVGRGTGRLLCLLFPQQACLSSCWLAGSSFGATSFAPFFARPHPPLTCLHQY